MHASDTAREVTCSQCIRLSIVVRVVYFGKEIITTPIFFLVCIYTQTIDGYVELEIKHSTAHIPKFRRPAHVYHHWPDRVSCQCCLLPLIIYIVILCRDMSIV